MLNQRSIVGLVLFLLLTGSPTAIRKADAEPLPKTQPLTWTGDIAMSMVEAVDQFLLHELELSIERRSKYWNRDLSSWDAYQASIEPQRKHLARILGLRDSRVDFQSPTKVATISHDGLLAEGDGYSIYGIRWPAFGDVHGEGLLLVPSERHAVANVIAIPDCESSPEQLAGLIKGITPSSQYARRLAQSGCRVVVPLLVNRQRKQFDWGARTAPDITNREMLYRSAFRTGSNDGRVRAAKGTGRR